MVFWTEARSARVPIFASGFVFLATCLAYWPFKVDDAYISFVYAKNLVLGNGLTYNGMVVEGYSNFLWTLLIAPFIGFGLDPLFSARMLSLLFAFLSLAILQGLIVRLIPGISKSAALLAGLAVAVQAPFVAWTAGGLETTFFGFLILLFIDTEHRHTKYSVWISPLIVLACALTRPEGVMLFPILLAYRIFHKKQTIWAIAGCGLFFLLPYALFLAWRYSTYGYFLPNTAYLKLSFSLQTFKLAAQWLLAYLYLRPVSAILVVGGLAALIVERRLLNKEWWLPSMTILAFIAFILYSGKDWMPHHRYLAPVVPLMGLWIAKIMAAFQRRILQLIVQSLTIAAVVLELLMAYTVYRPLTVQFGAYTDGLIEAGNWIRQQTRPDATIAVVDAGALAYYSERRTIDIIGLNNEYIAHLPSKSDPDYILGEKPAVLQLHVALSQGGNLNSTDLDVNDQITQHPGFSGCYRAVPQSLADPDYPVLFVRICD